MEEDTLWPDQWVRILADDRADGVWNRHGISGYPEDLPISADLVARIQAWQKWYDDAADEAYEHDPPFKTLDVISFAAEGLAIAHAVKAALPDWTVVYFDEARCAEVRHEKTGQPFASEDRARFEYEIFLSVEDTRRDGEGPGV